MQIPFFTSKDSKLFCNTPLHFTLTNRYNGISSQPYDSLNIAYHVNDKQSNVLQNRAYIMQKYYKDKTILYLNQIHSNTIFTTKHANTHIDSIPYSYNLGQIEKNEIYRSNIQQHKQYNETLIGNGDGIICDTSNVVLMSMVADCNPILIYSPTKQIFAILHAGRLGVCQKILTHALILLKSNYGIDICDILVFIGASIRKCCYVIGKDLAMQITNEFGTNHVLYENNQYRLDMIGLLCDELSACGIKPLQVEIHDCCTCCNEAYFSYRREGLTGRFGLFASLNY